VIRRLFGRQKIAAVPSLPDADRLKIGLIGVGVMGQHHARLLSGIPEARLLGIADMNRLRAEELAGKHGTKGFSSPDEFPADICAVVLATPTPTHYGLAKSLLQKGLHVFVEKPLTEKVEEAEELIALAQERGLVLQVGHIERFNPAVMEMARQAKDPVFIQSDRLGPFDPRVAHVGVVLDLMIHDLDIVLSLVKDKVVRLDAVGGRIFSEHEDIAKVTLHFSRGCRADLSASRASLKKFRKIRVFQKDAYLSLDYGDKSLQVVRKKDGPLRNVLDLSVGHPKIEIRDALESELKHFIACVKEGKTPLVSGQHGRDALELALEVRRAMNLHSL
jgi:predicted dehydrogenase